MMNKYIDDDLRGIIVTIENMDKLTIEQVKRFINYDDEITDMAFYFGNLNRSGLSDYYSERLIRERKEKIKKFLDENI